MNNLTQYYEKILKTLQSIENKMIILNQIRKPKLSDKELIAIDLTPEFMGIDSERNLFRNLPDRLLSKIERSVYNRRKRRLFYHRDLLQKKLVSNIGFNGYYIVDSMPLEVCKLSRSSRSSVCKESYDTASDTGYCASQSFNYYGYKLHAVCTIDGVFTDFDLSRASIHDIHYLKDIRNLHQDCTLLGDKGYLSVDCQLDLFSSHQIRLEVSMQRNKRIINLKPIFLENPENVLKLSFLDFVTNL